MTTLIEYQAQLAEVSVAITAVMTGGQSYTLDGRHMTRADLVDLNSRQAWLVSQIGSMSRGGKPRCVRVNFG